MGNTLVDADFQKVQERLVDHLRMIVRDRNPYFASEGRFFVQHYIREQLGKAGPVAAHEFAFQERSYYNWMLKLPGQSSNRPPVIVGAHYDTVPGSPGADDNATGIAVLLELARHFGQDPPRSPVWLVAFDMEEYGLSGSRALAEMLRQQRQPLQLMASLEMLGYCTHQPNSQQYPPGLKYFYPDTGNFIALIGNWQLIPTLIGLKRQLQRAKAPCQWLPVINQGLTLPDTRRSDHAPFWDAGYRALMITDTAYLRNPHYHQPSDTLETLDLEFLTRVCQGLMAGLGRV